MKIEIALKLSGVPPNGTKVQELSPKPWVWERDVDDWESFQRRLTSMMLNDFMDMLSGNVRKFRLLKDPVVVPAVAETPAPAEVPVEPVVVTPASNTPGS